MTPTTPQEEGETEAPRSGGDEKIRDGLAFVDRLDRTEQNAFLGLFAGARFPWTIYDNGRAPFIGKAECGWVEDWRDFYSRRLPKAGLFRWSEGESGPALGMVRKANGDYHTWTKIDCGPTELGRRVREGMVGSAQRSDGRRSHSGAPPMTTPAKRFYVVDITTIDEDGFASIAQSNAMTAAELSNYLAGWLPFDASLFDVVVWPVDDHGARIERDTLRGRWEDPREGEP